MKGKSLVSGFVNSANRFPDRPALEVGKQVVSYAELHHIASGIAYTIKRYDPSGTDVAAILAYRSVTAYAGILGILLSGKGYAPLNPRFPLERTLRMLELSGADILVVDEECIDQLNEILPHLKKPLTILLPETSNFVGRSKQLDLHTIIRCTGAKPPAAPADAPPVEPQSPAYLLFTSGSTGVPKGIPVSHGNVEAYLAYTCKRYDIDEDHRFSQHFDLTFDLSVHDMFLCWEVGACLCCVPESALMAPAKFIRDRQLTAWFAVPAVPMVMGRMRLLKPASFETLKYSLFCGEALPAEIAKAWQAAAPGSVVENLYGPTEATIAITNYTWNPSVSPGECINGVVPIGWVFDDHKACVVDHELKTVPQGECGELCLSGKQVTRGYLNNPEKTKSQYVALPGQGDSVWYRTGDLVKLDERGCLYYQGRIDNQIKIRGFRVELQEVDATVRRFAGTEMVVSVPWPANRENAEGIVSIICGAKTENEKEVINQCAKILPSYMVPKRCYFVQRMPLNANGKIDRLQLIDMIQRGEIS